MDYSDRVVKAAITSYFTLFQSRWQYLYYLFGCLGNGYEWTENGDIAAHDGRDMTVPTRNSFDDFSDQYQKMMDMNSPPPVEEIAAVSFLNTQMAEFYRLHIDYIASTMSCVHLTPFVPSPTFEAAKNFYLGQYGLLSTAMVLKTTTPWTIDPKWKRPILETIFSVKGVIFRSNANYNCADFDVNNPDHWFDVKEFERYQTLAKMPHVLFPEEVENDRKRAEIVAKVIGKLKEEMQSKKES
ncbi:MAG: hypothetical protein WC284_17330 [Candidimonas sp.]